MVAPFSISTVGLILGADQASEKIYIYLYINSVTWLQGNFVHIAKLTSHEISNYALSLLSPSK